MQMSGQTAPEMLLCPPASSAASRGALAAIELDDAHLAIAFHRRKLHLTDILNPLLPKLRLEFFHRHQFAPEVAAQNLAVPNQRQRRFLHNRPRTGNDSQASR